MDKLPKRDDDIYKDIEKFEDYELTDCILYEMMIRTEEVQNLIKEIVSFYKDNSKALIKYLNTTNHNIYYRRDIEPTSVQKLYYEGMEKSSILYKKFNSLYDLYKITYKTKSLYKKVFGENFYSIFKNYRKIGENRIEDLDEVGFIIDPDEREIKIVEIDEKNGFYIKTLISADFHSFDPNDYYDEDYNFDYNKAKKDFYDYIKSEKGRFDIGYKSEIRIINNFKRPKLEINELKANKIKIELNLNKSMDENKSYIEHIYKSLGSSNHKVPIELLGEELQLADDVVCFINKKTKEEHCFDAREYLSVQDKLADMLFIYDATKKRMKQKDIKQSIDDYYHERDLKKTGVDPTKTINKYLQISQEYIDNLKYKELLTGIKNK